MNILFVCSKNQWRSRTAETIFKDSVGHEIKSAGTNANARIRLTEKHIHWSDLIFVMEHKHKQIIQERFPWTNSSKIIVLDIPDVYTFMDEELIFSLKIALAPYLE